MLEQRAKVLRVTIYSAKRQKYKNVREMFRNVFKTSREGFYVKSPFRYEGHGCRTVSSLLESYMKISEKIKIIEINTKKVCFFFRKFCRNLPTSNYDCKNDHFHPVSFRVIISFLEFEIWINLNLVQSCFRSFFEARISLVRIFKIIFCDTTIYQYRI